MIEAIGLTKRYGKKVVVNNLTFTAKPGKVTGFLGPNGAGKSTTMRMVLGLDRPTAGEVRIDGRAYRDLKHPLRTVGALMDAKWVHPNRSARTHLRWLAKSNGIPGGRVDEVLGMVGLEEVAGRNAGGFSLGMSQRLGIAAALLGDPQVLMFDEPVNGLDPEGIHWIRRFMQGLAAEGRTVLVSSHLLSEMALTAEELVVIGRGELIAECSTEEFVTNAGDRSVLVRTPQVPVLQKALVEAGLSVQSTETDTLVVEDASTDQIGELAAERGVVLHELSARQGSLEEAFMQMTSGAVEYQTQLRGDGSDQLAGVAR
ncbi:ATP-binding cassette domain-containing protein [Saccharopolyspora cebuensis]|uniref:ATP-binding cassette domain-containing protein n=1 Tax=Saccharopolyspora cebuensis TaxID=418759 RepID=A0ABV4CI57_9PSEU